ncbi:putative baseplate assembly protein [Sorangium sp. So ce1182]|uniref:putative baseplate assembly protein n=1 Tax=Sorangium sp. So ce1182 TaxID=3133334 RepID=UPI003F6116E6
MQSLRPPKLDDRSFDDLRRELVRRIPVHAPAWTDHNPGDPGIALLEVFAWLAENLLHRLNRVPERSELHFLNLLNVPLNPARPARAMVRLEIASKDRPEPQLLPAGATAERALASAGKVQFQVLGEVEVLPVEALVAVKARAAEEDGRTILGLDEVVQALEENLGKTIVQQGDPRAAALKSGDAAGDKEDDGGEEAASVAKYTTRVLEPPRDGVPPAPTALAGAVDHALWIALLVPKGLKKTPQEIREATAGKVLSVGALLDATLCGPADVARCPDPGTAETAMPLVWQIASGRFTGPEKRLDQVRYERLAVEEDGTAGLSRSGVSRLRLPLAASGFGTWRFEPPPGGKQPPPSEEVVDPALEGAGDLPPLLDDAALAGRVVTWIRCFRPAPAQPAALASGKGKGDGSCAEGGEADGGTTASPARLPQPVVRWVDVNLVEVEQAVTAAPEILGNGVGRAGQALRLANTPVLAGSLFLEVREPVGWVRWTEVDSLAASAPDDPHFVLDAASGEVRFGDGIRGRMPRPGETIRARTYRYGGGVVGNVPAGAINRLHPPKDVAELRVTNPLPAAGGVDGETVEEAKARIPLVLRHRGRAVAADDFRELALETPGANLGRVEVLPRHKPEERVDGVPGVVTLVVLPAYDPLHPDEPVPDREALRKVCAYLEPRRLVTTELYVTAPEYVPVWISVAFEVEEGYGKQTVRRWVELAVRQYLAPLPPYGPAGQGWPFGRVVSAPDVEAAVLRVEGVRLVHSVLLEGPLAPQEEDGEEDGAAAAGNPLALRSWQLPVVRNVQLNTESATPDPIARDGDPARPDGGGGSGGGGSLPVPVPVIEEVC